jgi:hypothetical protein
MSEKIIEAPATQESSETPPVADLTASEPPAASEAPAPEPKKRGRPQGAKDTAKRTRKPVVKLRVEPIVREPLAMPKEPMAPPPQPPQLERQPLEAPEPKSPRTLFRMHHEAVVRERREKKQEYAQRYTANWTAWPV